MKVLLSAFACEPNKGSEPGVGWRWAMEIAKLGHEVHVLTRTKNRREIETEMRRTHSSGNPRFHYFDVAVISRLWQRGQPGVQLYCLVWQWFAFRLARRIHVRERFDRVHHITFVNARQPSFMGNLGIPFIFGPVAGGDRAPWRLRYRFGMRGWVADALRDGLNILARFNPLMRRTFRQATQIYVTSEQTMALVPAKYRAKAEIWPAVGVEVDHVTASPEDVGPPRGHEFRILYAGRLIYLKGMHLGLAAFADILRTQPEARLTLVGGGPDAGRLQRLAKRLGIVASVDWLPWMTQNELAAQYQSHDIFLFPSLRDSGGMVVLEAMAHGLPVVCLDLGGPGRLVDDTCGRVIETKGQGERSVVARMVREMQSFSTDRPLQLRLSRGARLRAETFTWKATTHHLYGKSLVSGNASA